MAVLIAAGVTNATAEWFQNGELMLRPYQGPRLWFDKKRGTWTICDGRKNIRTGCTQHEDALQAIKQYSKGTYNPERPKAPEKRVDDDKKGGWKLKGETGERSPHYPFERIYEPVTVEPPRPDRPPQRHSQLAQAQRPADRPTFLTLKEASQIHFAGKVTPSYLKGEIGLTMAGWRFGETVLTSEEYINDFKERFRLISLAAIDAPGVYVIGYNKLVKIGLSSTSIKQRIVTIQQGLPHALRIYASLSGGAEEEKSLHRRFKKYHVRGEWFRRAGDLVRWIEDDFK
jgi:hypothetical protein